MLEAARSPIDELRAHLHTRLDELAAARPDLDAALTLQRSLLGQEIELLNTFMSGGLPGLSLPPRYLAAKLDPLTIDQPSKIEPLRTRHIPA